METHLFWGQRSVSLPRHKNIAGVGYGALVSAGQCDFR